VEILLDIVAQLRDSFNHHILFGLAALLLAGYVLGKFANRLKLPVITGFIVAGFLLGESVTGIVHENISHYLTSVTEVALGIIALTIGCEFSAAKLKRLGWKIIIITTAQLLLTFIVVTFGLILIHVPIHVSILLGAIATATAPAATVAIVQSLRVRGEFVDYLYGIVALDDAGCVILFSAVFAIVSSIITGTGAGTAQIGHIIIHGLSEIGFSLILGLIAGFVLHFITYRQKLSNQLMILSVGMVFLVTAISVSLKLSPLLSNMMMGAVLINIARRNVRLLHVLEPLTPPLYAAFFAIAGTELKISEIASGTVLLIGLVYILYRMAGKYFGVLAGAAITKAPIEVKKYLGLCMFPQAGVAIGLVLFIETSPFFASASADTAGMMNLITSVVLFSVFINELVGPPLSKLGLVKGALDK